jgi:predicted ABC-type ATPase
MAAARPNVVVIAGPNGAGKSTIAPDVLRGAMSVVEFVNADWIAQGLSAFDPEGAAMAAGRIMLARLKELAEQQASRLRQRLPAEALHHGSPNYASRDTRSI